MTIFSTSNCEHGKNFGMARHAIGRVATFNICPSPAALDGEHGPSHTGTVPPSDSAWLLVSCRLPSVLLYHTYEGLLLIHCGSIYKTINQSMPRVGMRLFFMAPVAASSRQPVGWLLLPMMTLTILNCVHTHDMPSFR